MAEHIDALARYKKLVHGGEYLIAIDQAQSCVAIKVHDYGLGALDPSERRILEGLISVIKNQVRP